jgi:hypothetical protein
MRTQFIFYFLFFNEQIR